MAGVLESDRWCVLAPDAAAERTLREALGLGFLAARVLAARGVTDVDAAERFLTPSLDRDWHDPLEIPGLADVADRVERALDDGEAIAVFGDFDVDGMTSAALLTLGLRALGGSVEPFIPRRFDEGYGLSSEAVNRVVDQAAPSLIVTVDNGIASADEVARVRELGIDVAVTDHHEPGESVPKGVPVCDPKLDPACPSRDLAGVGVALKLLQELGRRRGQPRLWLDYLDLACLGTVSDMMELTAENRALVSAGIRQLREGRRPGLVALAAEARCDLSTIEADGLPFSLSPRLNAAGRMGDVQMAFDLLMADDRREAQALAERLEAVNQERRAIEGELSDKALAEAEHAYHGEPCVVLGGEGWHEGVKGIVASRVVSHFHVPSLVFSIQDGVARGSGRSVGSVDLYHAVDGCRDLLTRFGGHAGAVGVTMDADKLDEFRDRLTAELSALPAEQFQSREEVACVARLDELTLDGVAGLDALRPFGQGNKVPLMAVRGVTMRGRSLVGAGAEHLRFFASDGVSSVACIQFRAPDPAKAAAYDGLVDLVFEPVVEVWQGRSKVKLMVRDVIFREPEASPGAPGLVEALFERAPQILVRDSYAGVADEDSFFTKAVGVTQPGRQETVASLVPGQELLLRREPDNPADPQAIALFTQDGAPVGYLRRQIAAAIAPVMDRGQAYRCVVTDVTGGVPDAMGTERAWGANLEVSKVSVAAVESVAAAAARPDLAGLDAEGLTDALRRAMIGDHALLPAQARALEELAAGRSTLCVMATGRGKSLIFHIHAARRALLDGRASVFVYPLRALVNDQAFHLEEALEPFGISVRRLTGESGAEERAEVYAGLADGSVDVVLTTPEYLAIHSQEFAKAGRVGFVVIDEAHHAGASKGGDRGAYQELPRVLDELGRPEVLAVTATASDPVAQEVCRLGGIESVVKDVSVRDNLAIDDRRDLRDREGFVTGVVGTGEKTVIYVNSRDQSVALARMLRQRLPQLGQRIAFYNAGLTRSERVEVERAFRDGRLSCIVSTSAFGEGVNLPDIRHVVLYHLPFGAVEFNQMSGRAGRDGRPAQVHLLFGSGDARINERILGSQAPGREDLVALYRALKAYQAQADAAQEGSFSVSNQALVDAARVADPRTKLDEHAVSAGVGIFRELGFLTTSGRGTARRIALSPSPAKMDLSSSVRYREGLGALDDFGQFRDWALTADAAELLARINRPIAPGFGETCE